MSKREEVLLRTDDVSVRVLVLGPKEIVPWHSHSQVDDIMVCLLGLIAVRVRDPNQTSTLTPGQRCRVSSGCVHQVANLDSTDSEYLLIQGVGKYDFVALSPA